MKKPVPVRDPAAASLAVAQAVDLLRDGAGLVASVSGGKDSQAMVDYLCELLRFLGMNPAERLILVNADLGRAEWDVTEQLQGFASHYGVQVIVVKPPRDLITSIRRRGKWPDMARRYCTSDHKRDPIQKEIRRLSRIHGWTTVVHCTGERAEESPKRARLVSWEEDRKLSIRARAVFTWRPVLTLSIGEVWKRIEASGLPAHPIYAKGMRRLSCKLCVFASLHDLRIARREDPGLFDEYVEIERTSGHSFRQHFRLADLDTAEDDGMAGPA